jgi:hypothetical protein
MVNVVWHSPRSNCQFRRVQRRGVDAQPQFEQQLEGMRSSPQEGFSSTILRISVAAQAEFAAGRISTPLPEKLEAFAVPTDEGLG